MLEATTAGKVGQELEAIEDSWLASAKLKLFTDAVAEIINASSLPNKSLVISRFLEEAKGKSNGEARAIAKRITGTDVYWSWDAPRTREGYYRLQGGCGCAINRAIHYAPYADAVWMESKLPDFSQAEEFAKGVRGVWPDMKYVYVSFTYYFSSLCYNTSYIWQVDITYTDQIGKD